MKNKGLRDIAVSAVALALIGGVVTAALAGTNQLTTAAIERQAAEAENAARRQVIEADGFQKATLTYEGEDVVYYTAHKGGQPVGYVFTASVTGKSSGLVVMTGVTADGKVSGVKITEDNETAGYVDKVVGAGLLQAFQGKEAAVFTLGKDIDGVSQATKTSQGVTAGVNRAVAYYESITKGGGTP